MELFSVKGQVALITGASSGIGRHFAITLAKQGANIILVGRNEERLRKAEQECQKYNVKTLSVVADVKENSDVQKIINESKLKFPAINILVNAAGIAMRVPTLELSEQEWDNVININLKGTFLVSQAVAKWMTETNTAGKIINISSCASFYTTTTRSGYSVSKIGVESLTRSFALSLVANNIRVNCIAPGFFITDLTRDYLQTEIGKSELGIVPMQRAGDVTELEGILLLLASDASSYMNGAVVNIDGGFAISKV